MEYILNHISSKRFKLLHLGASEDFDPFLHHGQYDGDWSPNDPGGQQGRPFL